MLQRCITGLVLAAVVASIVLLTKPHVFFVISLLAYLLALFELCTLVGVQSKTWASFLVAAFMTLSIFCYLTVPIDWIVMLAAVYWLLIFALVLWYAACPFTLNEGVHYGCAVVASFALMFLWIALNWLKVQLGAWPLIATISLVCTVDMGGYFGGSRWGKHPLARRISPRKTIEGAVVGLLLALGVAVCLVRPMHLSFDRWLWGGVLALVILAMLGDLAESILKRIVGMKDSGQWLPGHGGLLDRMDSMAPVLPMLVLFYLLKTGYLQHLGWS